MPRGLYIPDAFTDTRDGRGITWGISHFTAANGWDTNHAVLARFDCDLSKDLHDLEMKKSASVHHLPEYFYRFHGLTGKRRARIA